MRSHTFSKINPAQGSCATCNESRHFGRISRESRKIVVKNSDSRVKPLKSPAAFQRGFRLADHALGPRGPQPLGGVKSGFGVAGMAGVTGLEPAASGVTGRRSNHLSYTPRRDARLGAAVMYSSPYRVSSSTHDLARHRAVVGDDGIEPPTFSV